MIDGMVRDAAMAMGGGGAKAVAPRRKPRRALQGKPGD